MFAIFKLIPLRDWFYGAAIVALVAFGFYEHAHLIDAGIQREKSAVAAKSAAVQVTAEKAIIVADSKHATAVAAIVRDYAKRSVADQNQLSADAQRLREYDAYRHLHPALARASAPNGTGASGIPSTQDYGDSFKRLESVALGLANAARGSDNALTACQQERSSLTGE